LQNLGKARKWSVPTIEKRRKRIQAFVDQGGYPEITPEEMQYLKKTAQALYKNILEVCTAGRRRFVQIHGADAVRTAASLAAVSGQKCRIAKIHSPRS
jgi:hypothetical protein